MRGLLFILVFLGAASGAVLVACVVGQGIENITESYDNANQ